MSGKIQLITPENFHVDWMAKVRNDRGAINWRRHSEEMLPRAPIVSTVKVETSMAAGLDRYADNNLEHSAKGKRHGQRNANHAERVGGSGRLAEHSRVGRLGCVCQAGDASRRVCLLLDRCWRVLHNLILCHY